MTIVIQDGIHFELNKNDFTAKIVKSISVSNSVFIPKSIFYQSTEYIVIKIDERAFEGNQLISSLLFDDNSEVRVIGKDSFKGSTLKYLFIPSSLTIFEEGWCNYAQRITKITVSPQNKHIQLVNDQMLIITNDINDEKVLTFALRNIEKVTIPSYVTKIASNSFESCQSLILLSFPNDSKLRSIGQKAFQFSRITKLSFPSSLEFLEEGWCYDMRNLVDIEINPNNKNFKYIDEKLLVGKGKEKDEIVLLFVKRNINDCIVPSCVTRIGQFSFGYCNNLNSISFKDDSKMKFISNAAFYNSQISSLSLPSSFEKMDEGWCLNAYSLKSILVSPKNKKFMYFDGSFLILNEKVLLFARRDIQNASIPSFITHIDNYAFDYCTKLETVSIEKDSSLIEIGDKAFNCCYSLTKISPFPVNLKRIGSFAFQFCEMIESIKFELTLNGKDSMLEFIGESAFDSCTNLKEISPIPKSVKKIGDSAFGGNENLESISFQEGSEVEFIGKNAFSYTSIVDIPIPSNVQCLDENFFLSHNFVLNFDIWQGNKYNEFIDQKYLISKSQNEIILNYVNPNVENVLIPSQITRIGTEAFKMCKKLNFVSFEKNSKIKSIAEKAFSYSSIKKLELPESLEILEDDWCFVVRDLIDIQISPDNENFKSIDNKFLIKKNSNNNNFFKGDDFIFACRDLKSIEIPSNIARIKNYAFSYCFKLKSISFMKLSVLKEIGSYSISNCNNLKSIISIPSSLKAVEQFAFSNNIMLESCEFLSDELIFNYGSFFECQSLNLLAFPNAKKITFGFNLFFNCTKNITVFILSNAEIQQNTM